MNGYLSTSLTRRVAEIYAGKPTSTSDKLSILVEIDCDVEKLGDSVVFADIAAESNFRDENEVSFDIGATLQLTTTPQQTGDGVWYLKMIATDEGRAVVRKYIDDHLEFSTEMSAKIMYGVLLYNMGKYNSSLAYLNKLLANPEDEDVALIHIHIARALCMLDDANNAWKHYETAYNLLRVIEPRRIDDEARVLIHMGLFCFDRHENNQALDYLRDARQLFEQVHGDVHIEVARALSCIGGCYEHKGNYKKAIKFYNQALEIHNKCADPNHLIQCLMLIALGNIYRLEHKYDEALNEFHRALDIRTRTLPEYHSDIADCLFLIGRTLGDMDNPSASVLYLMRALRMYMKVLPETELNEKGTVLVDIGIAFSNVGANKVALDYYKRAPTIKLKCFPRKHPDFAAIFENMALSYSYLGKHLLAFTYAFKARRLQKQVLPSTHPHMVGLMKVFATIYSRIGYYYKALHYILRARKVLKRTAFNNDPNWIEVNNQILRINRRIRRKKHNIPPRKIWKFNNSKEYYYVKLLSTLSEINLDLCLLP